MRENKLLSYWQNKKNKNTEVRITYSRFVNFFPSKKGLVTLASNVNNCTSSLSPYERNI